MEKKTYTTPQVELIKLDSEISFALESTPPAGPSEGASLAPEYMNNDTFRNNMG